MFFRFCSCWVLGVFFTHRVDKKERKRNGREEERKGEVGGGREGRETNSHCSPKHTTVCRSDRFRAMSMRLVAGGGSGPPRSGSLEVQAIRSDTLQFS